MRGLLKHAPRFAQRTSAIRGEAEAIGRKAAVWRFGKPLFCAKLRDGFTEPFFGRGSLHDYCTNLELGSVVPPPRSPRVELSTFSEPMICFG